MLLSKHALNCKETSAAVLTSHSQGLTSTSAFYEILIQKSVIQLFQKQLLCIFCIPCGLPLHLMIFRTDLLMFSVKTADQLFTPGRGGVSFVKAGILSAVEQTTLLLTGFDIYFNSCEVILFNDLFIHLTGLLHIKSIAASAPESAKKPFSICCPWTDGKIVALKT